MIEYLLPWLEIIIDLTIKFLFIFHKFSLIQPDSFFQYMKCVPWFAPSLYSLFRPVHSQRPPSRRCAPTLLVVSGLYKVSYTRSVSGSDFLHITIASGTALIRVLYRRWSVPRKGFKLRKTGTAYGRRYTWLPAVPVTRIRVQFSPRLV